MRILAVGHCTFRLEIAERTLFTDPWFTTSGPLYSLLMRRIYPLAIEPESIDQCDVMLVSHNHLDHISRPALRLARKLGTLVIGPKSVVRRATKNGIQNCRELGASDCVSLPGMRITAIPAVHPLAKDAIGFFVESSRNVYFSGDTRFDWSIVNALKGKNIDVAFLQVACAFRRLLSGADGMDINYADELAKAIRPRCVIPMHFDCVGKCLDILTNKRVSEHSLDVEDALRSFQRRLAHNDIPCHILFAGDAIDL